MNSEDMDARMQRMGCVQITSSNDVIYNNNNNSTGKLALSTKTTTVDNQTSCDSCSVDTTLTEYCLPADYINGTFPKELLETQLPSRQNSISSCTNPKHSNSSSTNSSIPMSMNRCSVYDNLSGDDDESPLPLTPLATPITQARRELDAVLQDLLINITNLDLDGVSSDVFKAADITGTGVDSAIVSPMSEDLSSLPSDTLAETPEVERRALSSSEELSNSMDNILAEDEEDVTGDMRHMQETIWRERRDSGVGSSLTREPT